VLRVPNAASWLQLHKRHDEGSRSVLAWNNLLGFPYLYGYTPHTLTKAARQYGFEPVQLFASELVTMPFPDPSAAVVREQREVSEMTRDRFVAGAMEPPWFEILFRRADHVQRCDAKPGRTFLKRAV